MLLELALTLYTNGLPRLCWPGKKKKLRSHPAAEKEDAADELRGNVMGALDLLVIVVAAASTLLRVVAPWAAPPQLFGVIVLRLFIVMAPEHRRSMSSAHALDRNTSNPHEWGHSLISMPHELRKASSKMSRAGSSISRASTGSR